jgi:hypothetical protein
MVARGTLSANISIGFAWCHYSRRDNSKLVRWLEVVQNVHRIENHEIMQNEL